VSRSSDGLPAGAEACGGKYRQDSALLAHSYKGTGSIPHANCKYLVRLHTGGAYTWEEVGCRGGWENDSSHGQSLVLN